MNAPIDRERQNHILARAQELIGREVYLSLSYEPRHVRWNEWKKSGKNQPGFMEPPVTVLAVQKDPGGLVFRVRRPDHVAKELQTEPKTVPVVMDLQRASDWLVDNGV